MAEKRKKHTIKSAKMPSIWKHVQQADFSSPSWTVLKKLTKRKNSPAERSIGASQVKRFLSNPRKFRGGPAARKK